LTAQVAALLERAAGIQGERELADLRREADEAVEFAVRAEDFRERAMGYRAIGVLEYKEKTELIRRGLEDESPACRGAALMSLEVLSRDRPGDVNGARASLHRLADSDPNMTVRRLAVICLKNGSAGNRDTSLLLDHISDAAEDPELAAAAKRVIDALKQRAHEDRERKRERERNR
jgi:hypothetical protein